MNKSPVNRYLVTNEQVSGNRYLVKWTSPKWTWFQMKRSQINAVSHEPVSNECSLKSTCLNWFWKECAGLQGTSLTWKCSKIKRPQMNVNVVSNQCISNEQVWNERNLKWKVSNKWSQMNISQLSWNPCKQFATRKHVVLKLVKKRC